MNISEQLIYRKNLNNNLLKEIENFINENSNRINSLFISPVFADDNFNKYKVDYAYNIYFLNDEIVALKLIFFEYKFYQRIIKLNKYIQNFLRFFLKLFFSKKKWLIPLLIQEDLNKNYRMQIILLYKNSISKYKKIYKSPISVNIENKKKIIRWATYLLDLSNQNYKLVYSGYKKTLKKNLKTFSKNENYYYTTINFFDKKLLLKYIEWIKKTQKRYGKNIHYSYENIINYKKKLLEKNFYFEIFLLMTKNNQILASLTIFGDKNYINEYEVNYSLINNKLNFSLHDILRDKAIKFAINNDIKFYDFSGFNPSPNVNTKDYNITFSKSKFNGKIVEFSLINT